MAPCHGAHVAAVIGLRVTFVSNEQFQVLLDSPEDLLNILIITVLRIRPGRQQPRHDETAATRVGLGRDETVPVSRPHEL